ncbi:PEP-utilizing enzyme [Nocardia yamanashiensis]|uniref:PEP-utilizing enzyme n=1 Tax=Nocardia yamanashiensis TaxID=209247 RepID=UPI001C3F86BD|nr:PEP-utilizing enzyme [Nocardia yamanashiensis]
MGEAFPGVLTPLGWSLCGPSVELGIRDCYARVGALPRREVRIPERMEDRLISVFYGRGALNVNFFCRMGAHLPGTAPDAIARQFLGELPDGIPSERNHRRWPIVAAKTAYTQATIRRDVLRRTSPVSPWWRHHIARMDERDLDGARLVLAEAHIWFKEMIRLQAAGLFVAIQSVYDQFLALLARSDLDPDHANALISGQGDHAETAMITDLWALSRGRIKLADFLSEHGYHGPLEGEISSLVWREDPTPVLRLAEHYRSLGDDADPVAAAVHRAGKRHDAERALLGSLSPWQRPAARVVLAATASRMPLRGVAKASFLQAFDVARGAARRMGTQLLDRGVISEPEDVFYFTVDELCGQLPDDPAGVVAQRRAERTTFATMTLPASWQGTPVPISATDARPSTRERSVITGIGASGGVVEGVVRVIEDPAFNDLAEAGEVLVCGTTDPSWASVIVLAAALIVDVGGLLSHAAVVAREIGVPCVIGTGDGSAVLRTGDRVRVNGTSGTVEILTRASGANTVGAQS